ncbi:hypothetical protein ACVW0P_002543 [Mucilaginibacter sp. UYNi724]
MKRIHYLLIALFFTIYIPDTLAQNSVDVDPLTGTAKVAIPIYQINKGNISVPVTLVYGGRGVKPKDVEGTAGIGFNISVGGQIGRDVRGLPDDVQKDALGNSRMGWLYNNTGDAAAGFTIVNDNSTATCTDETSDINYINANFAGYVDTEPDIFSVTAPGLSCQLVLDKSHVFKILNYQDLKIEYVTFANEIVSFNITNNRGIKYTFDSPERVTRKAVPIAPNAPVNYFFNTYKQYQYGVSFNNNWYLSRISDVNANSVNFEYTSGPERNSSDPVELFISGSTTKSTQFVMQESSTQHVLSAIGNGVDQLSLKWQSNFFAAGGTNISYISSITGMGRTFQFNYSTVNFIKPDNILYTRVFLRNIYDSGCSSPVNYNFTYYGESSPTTGNYTTVLSDSSSTHSDYWGYFNTNSSTSIIPAVYVNAGNPAYPRYENYTYPNTNGSDYTIGLGENGKYVDPAVLSAGSLKTITNANGGVSSIVYEPNDYIDVPSNTVSPGNGIRVLKITDNDGISSANDVVRNYTYTDPILGKSSGRPISIPVYAFTIPYTGPETGISYWAKATVISANDLSNDDHTIIYKYCRETKTGAGSTLFEHDIPATQWDNNAIPGCASCTTSDWLRTMIYIARPTCASFGQVKNDIYTYPFPPAANYDHERGLLRKVTNFNGLGLPVSETAYTYIRTGTPLVIYAVKIEDNNGVKAYSRYSIYASTSELTSQLTKKNYGSSGSSLTQTSITNFSYGNNYHQLVQQQVTNSDNSVTTVNTSYSKNFAIGSPGGDSTANAIFRLQKLNIDVPVERYTQITRAGSTGTVMAQLTRFKTFAFPGNIYAYLPVQTSKFIAPDGAAFTPFSISAGIAASDPKYNTSSNFTAYDSIGKLLTADDNNKHVITMITDYISDNVVASFKGAAFSEIGFEDFDSKLPLRSNFTLSVPTGIVGTQSHTGNSYALNAGQAISKIMVKKTNENYYILSAWISSTTAGNLTLTLTAGSASYNYSEPFTNTANTSRYFEWKVPVNNINSVFTISFTSTTSVNIDDIVFYPQSTVAGTYAYEPFTHFKIAETNTNGVSTYFTSDKFGRVTLIYDQDKNIIKRKSFLNTDDISAGLTMPFFSPVSSNIDINTVVAFDVQHNPCIVNATFTWDFGDGTTGSVLNGYHQAHTYTAIGNYTVTCTVSSPSYNGTLTSSLSNVVIKYPILEATFCQSGVTMWDNCYHHSLNQVDCSPNPNDATHSYYTITSVKGSGYGTLHYQWQLSVNNGLNWSNTGTDAPQLVKSCAPKNQAYRIKCLVTSSVGQSGNSGYALFEVVDCQ